MVPCNCGKKSGVAYQVTLADRTVLTPSYPTLSEAQAAGQQSGQAFTVKAVAA